MSRKKITVPPWCSFGPVKEILEKNKQVTLKKIDADTLRLYDVGRGYENKILSALRWLGLIDENDAVTSKLTQLKVTGKEFEDKLAEVATDAYSDLIEVAPPNASLVA